MSTILTNFTDMMVGPITSAAARDPWLWASDRSGIPMYYV